MLLMRIPLSPLPPSLSLSIRIKTYKPLQRRKPPLPLMPRKGENAVKNKINALHLNLNFKLPPSLSLSIRIKTYKARHPPTKAATAKKR